MLDGDGVYEGQVFRTAMQGDEGGLDAVGIQVRYGATLGPPEVPRTNHRAGTFGS